MNYLSSEKVVNWADKIMIEKYNDLLSDISLSNGDKNSILTALCALRKDVSSDVYIHYLSMYNKFLKNNISEWPFVVKEICKLYSMGFIKKENDENFFVLRLYDYYELQKDHLPPNMDMPNELITFLSHFNEDLGIFKKLNFDVGGVSINIL